MCCSQLVLSMVTAERSGRRERMHEEEEEQELEVSTLPLEARHSSKHGKTVLPPLAPLLKRDSVNCIPRSYRSREKRLLYHFLLRFGSERKAVVHYLLSHIQSDRV